MNRGETYYDVLGVPTNASQEEIRAAYLSLARRYHPDIDRSPGANARMAKINIAYETLSDPRKRLQYDLEIGLREAEEVSAYEAEGHQETIFSPGYSPEQDISITCDDCGRLDSSLRLRVFLFVISAVVMSYRKGVGGLLCSSCALKRSLRFTIMSMITGPWGVPWGIFWTLQAIWVNLGGGIQPELANAVLLKLVAARLYLFGRYQEAAESLEASLQFHFDPEVQAAASELRDIGERLGQPITKTKIIQTRTAVFRIGGLFAFAALLAAVGSCMFQVWFAEGGQQTSIETQAQAAARTLETEYRNVIASWMSQPYPAGTCTAYSGTTTYYYISCTSPDGPGLSCTYDSNGILECNWTSFEEDLKRAYVYKIAGEIEQQYGAWCSVSGSRSTYSLTCWNLYGSVTCLVTFYSDNQPYMSCR